jgi:hypothetical protein
MLALIPIIGPSFSIALGAGWEVIRVGLIATGNPIPIGPPLAPKNWAFLIGLAVWALAF